MNEDSFPVEAVSSFQPYKDEHISDEEIITYYSAGENEPDTWYPSESDFENWKQSRDKKNEIKEEFEQGLHEGQLLLLHLVEQEPVSDENLEGSSFIEENRAEYWYPSESEGRYWKQQEEKTCIDKEEVKQVPEKNKKKNVKLLIPSARTYAGYRDLNMPTAGSIASVQSPIVVDNTSTNWMLWSMRKQRNSLSLDVKQPKKKNQAQSRSRCPQMQERNDHGEPQNAAGNAVKCRYCGICVSNDYILKHQKNCIAKSTWKRYPQEENLSREELVHAGGKRYSCEICGRRFTRSHDVTRHKRSHTGEKPYSCDVCGKAFSRAGILTSHKRLHTGERPYLCNICGKRYMHSGAFNYHKLTHKEGEQFLCEICGERFIGMEILLLHKLIHTVEQPYIFM